MSVFMDGPAPGCTCTTGCGFPCWQRAGIAPPCSACGCASRRDAARMVERTRSQQQAAELRHVRRAVGR